MNSSGLVPLRLIRDSDIPATNRSNRPYRFGLQDTKQIVLEGRRRDDGALVFDFALSVRPGGDPDRPVFTGRFASGPPSDRFVYLSWQLLDGSGYLNRIKARLGGVDWALVRAAQAAARPLVADMSGWTPHDPRKQVEWTLGSD
ncbi:DUF5990 family protein [Caulobacter sp. 17J80-11]|uniref:DUF5990 family protein n=1 Tax=Caulobacter sp. 17J80-11 TaxID=2763502 RepID=UPI001653DFD5|nr:DUF5990 family protein [Caulobacter sp. 17J80-11]MBC6981392.1 hypothetical protein [Caulobacter sp. 17J80-11]